jgi:hypothetical protein
MGEARRDRYLKHPPSHAVDGRPDTAFCSFQGAIVINIMIEWHTYTYALIRFFGSIPRGNFRVGMY